MPELLSAMSDPDLTDDEIGTYYDRHEAHHVAELPEDGRKHLRAHYIDGVRQNPEAQRHIRAILRSERRPNSQLAFFQKLIDDVHRGYR